MRAHIRIVTLVLLLTPAVVPGLTAATANAEVIHVCWDGSGDYLTIQEGIDAAQDGDEVVVCDGVYTGPRNKNLDFGGKAITVRAANGPDNCIIDCEDDGRGFYFHSGETEQAVVDGFTITNGGAWTGGGISCEGSSPTVINCTLSENAAAAGGGMAIIDSSPTVINCTFSGNGVFGDRACGRGGGMCNEFSSPTVINCTFSGNWAADGYGGGMFNFEGSPTVANCTFSGNWADRGGGMDNGFGSQTIINCTFSGNAAWAGGGMWNRDGSPRVANCTFSGNWAPDGYGGGMAIIDSSPTVTNCTFAGNSATNGAAVACGCVYHPNIVEIANCILWDGGDEIYNEDGSTITVTYSDVQGGWPGTGNIDADPLFVGGPIGSWTADGVYDLQTCQVTLTDANASWDVDELVGRFINPDTSQPLHFVIVANTTTTVTIWADWATINTGDSWVMSGASYQIHDYHLTPGSPCIDAACNWGVPPDVADLDDDGDTHEVTPLDLDGEGRFFDDPDTDDTGCGCPPIVDMGAYEFGDAGPQPCPGDLDCDRDVDESDLGILLAAWHRTGDGDLNCDGDTNHADLGILLGNWGNACP